MNSRLPIEVHPIVRQLIDRDCHVGESYRTVIRHVVSKLRGGHKTFRRMQKVDRRLLIQQCIEQHRTSRELYVSVMYPSYKPIEEDQ